METVDASFVSFTSMSQLPALPRIDLNSVQSFLSEVSAFPKREECEGKVWAKGIMSATDCYAADLY